MFRPEGYVLLKPAMIRKQARKTVMVEADDLDDAAHRAEEKIKKIYHALNIKRVLINKITEDEMLPYPLFPEEFQYG